MKDDGLISRHALLIALGAAGLVSCAGGSFPNMSAIPNSQDRRRAQSTAKISGSYELVQTPMGYAVLDGSGGTVFDVRLTSDRSHLEMTSSYAPARTTGLRGITSYNTPCTYDNGIVLTATSAGVTTHSSAVERGYANYVRNGSSGVVTSTRLPKPISFTPQSRAGGGGGGVGKPPVTEIGGGMSKTCINDTANLIAAGMALVAFAIINAAQLGLDPVTDALFMVALAAYYAAWAGWVNDGCGDVDMGQDGVIWLY
jgi:hypothetical protein